MANELDWFVGAGFCYDILTMPAASFAWKQKFLNW